MFISMQVHVMLADCPFVGHQIYLDQIASLVVGQSVVVFLVPHQVLDAGGVDGVEKGAHGLGDGLAACQLCHLVAVLPLALAHVVGVAVWQSLGQSTLVVPLRVRVHLLLGGQAQWTVQDGHGELQLHVELLEGADNLGDANEGEGGKLGVHDVLVQRGDALILDVHVATGGEEWEVELVARA